MLDMMFEIPSRDDVVECLVTEEVILKRGSPVLTLSNDLKKRIA
jgi:ATP-dependent Clp protease ATP-binding subunit ClpX